jgi:hypothetical protein
MLYYILYFVVFLALLSAVSKKESVSYTLFGIAVIALILVNGLRDPFVYPDNINYYYFFEGHFDYAGEGTLGWGYVTFTKIIRFLTSYYPVYFFVIAVLIIGSYAKTIKDYSPYIWVSLIIFILVNYYPTFFLLRQYLVMPLFFFCVKYTIERKLIPYMICILLAFTVHTTSVIIAPLYFLYGIQYSKWNMTWVAIGTVLAIGAFVLIGPLMSFVGSYYLHYFDLEQEEPAWQRAVMKVSIMVVYLFGMGKYFYKEGINRILFYSFLFNVVICVGAINLYGVFRLRDYFSIADIIGIPVVLATTKNKNTIKRILVVVAIIVYIYLLYVSCRSFIDGGNMEGFYQFFWNGHPTER